MRFVLAPFIFILISLRALAAGEPENCEAEFDAVAKRKKQVELAAAEAKTAEETTVPVALKPIKFTRFKDDLERAEGIFKSNESKAAIAKIIKHGGGESEEAVLLLANQEMKDELEAIAKLPPPQARAELIRLRSSISQSIFASTKNMPVATPEAIAAARASELSTIPGYKTFRASTEDVIAVRQKYPGLGKGIDDFTDDLKELKLRDLSQEKLQEYLRKSLGADLANRFDNQLDPATKAAMIKVWSKMNDPDAFGKYVRSLSEDAAAEMAANGSQRELDALARGELTRNGVMKVLVKRHEAQGNGVFSTIVGGGTKPASLTRKLGTNVDFRSAVGQGPFFDKPFGESRHGIDTHFLQIDYVSDAVWEATNGEPRKFWDFLGSPKGIRYWVPLFDNFSTNTMASPENLAHKTSRLLKITD